MIRFDDNASAAVLPEAWRAYVDAATRTHVDDADAREHIRACVGAAHADELHFVSGGTEADALVVGCVLARRWGDYIPHVITSTVEHAAMAQALTRFEKAGRIAVTRIPLNRMGELNVDAVRAAVRPETCLVSLVFGSNETGIVLPIADIARVVDAARALAPNVVLHTDAVQVVGKQPVDVQELGVDALSFSGHKVGAVGGIGVLYARRDTWIGKQLTGKHISFAGTMVAGDACAQDGCGLLWQMRGDVDNAAGICSLAAALSVPRVDAKAQAALRDQFEQALLDGLPDIEVIGQHAPRLAHVSSIRFGGCEGDGLMMALDLARIAVSTGSACSSGAIEPSPILLGMGLTPDEAKRVVRFSLARTAQESDIQKAVACIVPMVQRMRLR